MVRVRFLVVLLASMSVLFCGCHNKLYEHSDSEHGVRISYPGNVDVFSDKAVLAQHTARGSGEAPVDAPKLLFVVSTLAKSKLTFALHQLPENASLSAEEYYQASTAQELEKLGVDIVEPKAEVNINGRDFLSVGFLLKAGETPLRSRLYQYLQPDSGKVAVITTTGLESNWDKEAPLLETMAKSVILDW